MDISFKQNINIKNTRSHVGAHTQPVPQRSRARTCTSMHTCNFRSGLDRLGTPFSRGGGGVEKPERPSALQPTTEIRSGLDFYV